MECAIRQHPLSAACRLTPETLGHLSNSSHDSIQSLVPLLVAIQNSIKFNISLKKFGPLKTIDTIT